MGAIQDSNLSSQGEAGLDGLALFVLQLEDGNLWKTYISTIKRYPKLSLQEERRLIRQAKKQKEKADELVLRHVSFIIFRICKKTFPRYIERFGEDILSQAIFMLYMKIKTYNLRYYDKEGNFKPVRFVSYIWKAVDGHILTCLKKELEKERRYETLDWERFNEELRPVEINQFSSL